MGIDTLLKAAPPRYTAQVASWADKIDQMRSIGWSWGDIAAALAPDLGWVLPGVDQSAQARVLGERLRISTRGARAAIAVGKLKPEQPKTTAAADAEPQRPGVALSQTMDPEIPEYLAERVRQKADGALSSASCLLGLDFERLSAHELAAGAALDLEPHSRKIAEMLRRGIHPTTILKIVSARLGISHHVAAYAIQICLNGTGVEFKPPRGERPETSAMGDDLQAEASALAASAASTPTAGATK